MLAAGALLPLTLSEFGAKALDPDIGGPQRLLPAGQFLVLPLGLTGLGSDLLERLMQVRIEAPIGVFQRGQISFERHQLRLLLATVVLRASRGRL